jgi:hypothetical protein
MSSQVSSVVKQQSKINISLKEWSFLATIWLHVTLLDLFYITSHGIVFLWHDNAQIKTLLTHAFIAFLSLGFYLLVRGICQGYQRRLVGSKR